MLKPEQLFNGSLVLVTGGAGFLGTHFVNKLLSYGARVRATLHQQEPKVSHPAVEYLHCDLCKPEDCVTAVAGVDYVFHCAANTQGAGVIATTPMAHVTPNVVMNTQLLEAAYAAGVKKFLFVSSGAAYPDTGDVPASEEDMLKDHPSPVYHAVAWMKRYAEILCETYASHLKKPMPCVVIRPSNIYGPWDKFDPEKSHVTAAMIRKVFLRQLPIQVWGTGEDIRDVIYIEDFIEGALAAFCYEVDYLAVNICSGQGVSVKDILAAALAEQNLMESDVVFDSSKPSTVAKRLLSNRLAEKLLSFTSKTNLDEGMRKTFDALASHPDMINK